MTSTGPSKVILFFLLSHVALVHAAVLDCDVDGKSVNPSNGHTTAGLSGLMRCVDRDTRQVQREQELQGGKFMGLERFFEQGKLIREHRTNESGNKEGVARTFSPAGKLLAEEFYRSGSNFGLQKHFFESGTLRRLNFYDLSKSSPANMPFIHTEDIASIEFNEDGKLAALRCAKRPILKFEKVDDTGLCGFSGESRVDLFSRDSLAERRVLRQGEVIARTTYWPGGQIRTESGPHADQYRDTQFRQSGQKLKETDYAVAAGARTKIAERDFHESGQLISERRWAQGQLASEATWYLNGQPKTMREYRAQEMVRREFHDNGQKRFEGTYVRDRSALRPAGEHLFFDEKGRLRSQNTYDERGRISRERELDENGKLTRDDAVYEDGSRKAFSR